MRERIIREEEPPKPSVKLRSSATLPAVAEKRQLEPARLGNLIKGDLDWIVMKALDKDRTRRFGSAAALGQDVQRFLNSEPIESRPPSAGYRLRKVAWRHRVGLAMTVIAAMAVVATGLSFAFAAVFRRAEQTTLYRLRDTLFDHGVTLIMNVSSRGVGEVIRQLTDAGADDLAEKLRAIQLLHDDKPREAVDLLERLVQENPQDAGLRAMLSDGYDQAGEIGMFVESFRQLKSLDTSHLHPIELIYAALAGIVEPAWGVARAEEAVRKSPTSPYARLVRGRMTMDFLCRSCDVQSDTSEAKRTWTRGLVNRAINDVESLKFLYDHDRRTVGLSVSTYLGAAHMRRQLGDADWQNTLHLADDAVKYLETHHPTAWDKFFLAAYYRELAQDGELPEKVWELYRAAAVDDGNDYHAAYSLAACYELGRTPPAELLEPVSGIGEKLFRTFGLACWYALNGEEDKAREQVEGLRRIQTISSVTYAVMVLHLLKDKATAARFIEEYANSQAGREQLALRGWIDTDLFHFFRAELKGSPQERPAIREKLLRDARGSDHPVTNRFFALWAIALCNWAEGNEAEALQQFRTCADMRQGAFPVFMWSRAIVRRAGDH